MQVFIPDADSNLLPNVLALTILKCWTCRCCQIKCWTWPLSVNGPDGVSLFGNWLLEIW